MGAVAVGGLEGVGPWLAGAGLSGFAGRWSVTRGSQTKRARVTEDGKVEAALSFLVEERLHSLTVMCTLRGHLCPPRASSHSYLSSHGRRLARAVAGAARRLQAVPPARTRGRADGRSPTGRWSGVGEGGDVARRVAATQVHISDGSRCSRSVPGGCSSLTSSRRSRPVVVEE